MSLGGWTALILGWDSLALSAIAIVLKGTELDRGEDAVALGSHLWMEQKWLYFH